MEEDLEIFLEDTDFLPQPLSPPDRLPEDIEQLLLDVAVVGQSQSHTFKYYTFEVPNTSRVLIIQTKPVYPTSDPEIYVSRTHTYVTPQNCTWSFVKIGSDKFEIYPNDPEYKPGAYHIGIYANGEGMNVFTVRAYFSKPCTMIDLEDTYSGILDTWSYFKFPIKYGGESRLEVCINPGWSKVCMFVSSGYYFPNETEHEWSLGYYGENDIKKENRLYDCECILDNDPFDELLRRDFVRKPDFRELCESKKEKKEKQTDRLAEEELRLCIDTDRFQHLSDVCYIGVKNLTSSPLSFCISSSEIPYISLLPHNHQNIIHLLQHKYSHISPKHLSYLDRISNSLTGHSEFIYGEVEFIHLAALLQTCLLKDGEVFWDLGSGVGKCIVEVGLMYPRVTVWGVEKLKSLYRVSKEIIENLERERNMSNVHVVEGDLRDVDWTNGDVVFISDLTFPVDLMSFIERKIKLMKVGARVVTLRSLMPWDYIKEVKCLRVKMSWGRSEVFIYEKI